MKYPAAIAGLILLAVGFGVMAIGVLSGGAFSSCSGESCGSDLAAFSLPVGIIAIVFGSILASSGLGSLRRDRGWDGPWTAFGFLTGLGLLFLAMGWLFLYSARNSGDEGDALLFVGALFTVMGLAFVGSDAWRARGMARQRRLRVSGLKGTATVLAMRDSSWTVNNNPMVNLDLQVTMPGQPPFRTQKRTVLSRLSVGSVQPGAVLPVLADPNQPTKVTIDWDSAAASEPDGEVDLSAFGIRPGQMLGGAMNADLLRQVSQALSSAADRAASGEGHVEHGQVVGGSPTVIVNGQVIDLRGSSASGHGGTPLQGYQGIAIPSVIAGSAAAIGPAPADAAGVVAGSPAAPGASGSGAAPGSAVPVAVPSTGTGGITGRVTLDSIQNTGVEMSGSHLYAFDLTVLVPGQPGYTIKQAALVPQAQVPRLVQGASFPAIIDPEQKGQLVVEWDR